jgi:molecular chaperone HscC
MLVGIDLGTTHSLIGAFIDGAPRLFPNPLGRLLTPSAVGLLEDGTLVVGEIARERWLARDGAAAADFKRWMGSGREIRLGQRAFRPEELSALVIRSLLDDAEAATGRRPTEAVISVPAYFSDAQRRATRAAGELAGLKVERLINEPTAAALAYGLRERLDEATIMVLDLGGGTFDVSILELFDGVVKVHASAGDNMLGGNDFTRAIVQAFCAEHGLEAERLPPALRPRVFALAERMKHGLSTGVQRFELDVDGATRAFALDEHDFELLCEPLLQRLRAPVERALRDAGLRPADLSEVILVGGASRMPLVARMASRMLGRLPLRHVQPDEAIALGACVAAGLKGRDVALEEVLLTDVCPYTLGLEVSIEHAPGQRTDGHFEPLIERNTTVPVSRVREYFPVRDGQRMITLRVFQGEHPRTEHNILLGSLDVALPAGPIGDSGVEVRFTYDVNGVLQVEARVQRTGATHELIVQQHGQQIPPGELRARLEALASLKVHPRDEQPNQVLIARAERLFMERLGDERAHVQQMLAQFRAVLDRQDRGQIEQARAGFARALDELDRPL